MRTFNLKSILRCAAIAIMACSANINVRADLVQVTSANFNESQTYYLYNVAVGKYVQFVTDTTTFTQTYQVNATPFVDTTDDATGFTIKSTSKGFTLSTGDNYIGISKKSNGTIPMVWNAIPVEADSAATFKLDCNAGVFTICRTDTTLWWKYDGTNNYAYMNGCATDDIQWYIYTDVDASNLKTSLNFDENDESVDFTNLAENVTVTLNKTLTANKKNSICFPFKMTAAQVKAAFGEGTKVYEFEKIANNYIYFSVTTAIRAGEPCVLVPAQVADDNTYVIDNVAAVNICAAPNDVKHNGYIMHGTFSAKNMSGFYCYNDGELTLFKNERALTAYTSFLVSTDANATKLANAVEFDEEVDGISNVTFEYSDATPIYNVNGQMVRRSSTSTDGLTPGIYVINGKKVLVK